MGEWNEGRDLFWMNEFQDPGVKAAFSALIRGDLTGFTDVETPAPKSKHTGNRKARRAKAKGK